MKRFAIALAAAAALALVPAQSRADQGVQADNPAAAQITSAVLNSTDAPAQVTDVRWGRYRRGYYYPRYYNYYPRYSYGYYPRYYGYGYPSYRYGYRYNYGYRPGFSFGWRF
jgi:hypothetical protein